MLQKFKFDKNQDLKNLKISIWFSRGFRITQGFGVTQG